ncbi:MAG: thioredoxin fold domain-containing protein [Deltaproteobacteria bacterium]|nr:thioredoxin fold domain-containing protein [Deltaproteobacteria bacterium]
MTKKKSIFHIVRITFFILTIGFSITAAASEIKWHDYEKGLALGKDSNKKIMINFYGEWCRYCKKMEKETFAAAKVADYLNANFISIRINSDKNENLVRAFKVTGLPVTWFLTENGDKIGNRPGWVKADKFLELLEYVHTEGYK